MESSEGDRDSVARQPSAILACHLPCSHVVLVPVGVHHNLLHAHILLGAVILAQVVISDDHSESQLAGERGKPEGLPFPLGGKCENGLAG